MILLIVDPQIDFVSGSLVVPGAPEAMQTLAAYMDSHREAITGVVVTMDQHPIDHCSFVAQGGQWPPHCVRYTVGAAIEPCIAEALARCYEMGIPVEMLEKATTTERDAYSAFEAEVPQMLCTAEEIVVAGIAGDYCVRQSVLDLERHGLGDRIRLLQEGIAYISPEEA